jgi:hypothetical protein
MSYGETKVYFDGSHYIAIPHTERPTKKRPKPIEEIITVIQENDEGSANGNLTEPSVSLEQTDNNFEVSVNENLEEKTQIETKNSEKLSKNTQKMTKKEYFNELYMKFIDLPKRKRREKIIDEMRNYFPKLEYCENFVDANLERKQRNLICRRVRMCRKANLAGFNYFCTFTYDDKKHTESTFKHKLKACFRNMCFRKNWKYMGVWERAPKTNRLHFHGLFNIPPNAMPGQIIEVRDYSTQFNKMQKTFQSSYFNERFGRSDFKEIDEQERRLGNALAYLMKYMEKTGEKIVYSKGLPQYFISDIMDDDIVCTIGQEDKKLLLFDDFNCWDEGVLMGKVSPEVIEQMRKCNN